MDHTVYLNCLWSASNRLNHDEKGAEENWKIAKAKFSLIFDFSLNVKINCSTALKRSEMSFKQMLANASLRVDFPNL